MRPRGAGALERAPRGGGHAPRRSHGRLWLLPAPDAPARRRRHSGGARRRGRAALSHVLVVGVAPRRADRRGVYGSSRPTTPNLEAFAKEGVVFTGARS